MKHISALGKNRMSVLNRLWILVIFNIPGPVRTYDTSRHTAPHYTTPHHATQCHATLQHDTLHNNILRYITTLHLATPHYATPRHATPQHATLHRATLHHATLHYATQHYATLHHAKLHHATWRLATPCHIIQYWAIPHHDTHEEMNIFYVYRMFTNNCSEHQMNKKWWQVMFICKH